jgi:hypothetical protein
MKLVVAFLDFAKASEKARENKGGGGDVKREIR